MSLQLEEGTPCWVSDDLENWYPRIFYKRDSLGYYLTERHSPDTNQHLISIWFFCRLDDPKLDVL